MVAQYVSNAYFPADKALRIDAAGREQNQMGGETP